VEEPGEANYVMQPTDILKLEENKGEINEEKGHIKIEEIDEWWLVVRPGIYSDPHYRIYRLSEMHLQGMK
jgi:hypothetical protein